MRTRTTLICILLFFSWMSSTAAALERLCDPAYEDCRALLLGYINNETTGIDVSFWFMEDGRYANALVAKHKAGVPVRVMMDSRADANYPNNKTILDQLQADGIPMREKYTGGINHRKFMLFARQNVVEFSGANYSPTAFVPLAPYANYEDEAIYFTDDPAVVNSFKTVMDDMWTSTTSYRNYANISSPSRQYPTYSIDRALNFPPGQDYASRAVARYNAETVKIDVDMYRITDRRHSDAMIDAFVNRHVPIRLYTDTFEYRNASRLWHAWNVDRMWLAGIPIRVPAHQGINHEKAVLLYGQGMTIFGSSNWTSPSANSQAEHNYFTNKPALFAWFVNQFDRKWNNSQGETAPFTPLPPDAPVYQTPVDGAVGLATSGVKLVWYGGPWAHVYDVYVGTDPANLYLIGANQDLGPSTSTSVTQSFTLPTLAPGTTYYWKVVSKTAALLEKSGLVGSFTTSGSGLPVDSRGQWDTNGDGRSDIAVWRPGNGMWYLTGGGVAGQTVQWGTSTDVPVPGDYDGDGRGDAAVWRPGDGTWYVLTAASSYTRSFAVQWGSAQLGDVPVPADYDGDGRTDVAVWRPGSGTWFVIPSAHPDASHVMAVAWGAGSQGDIPVPADYDGDGRADLAVWRPGNGVWYVLPSPLGPANRGPMSVQWGSAASTDRPVPADYDGDGKADIAVWRAATGRWYILESSTGYSGSKALVKNWGNGNLGDVPITVDYDGDGRADITVWRPGDGTWYTLQSSSSYTTSATRQWGSGAEHDVPIW